MGRSEKALTIFWWGYFGVYIACMGVLYESGHYLRLYHYAIPFHVFGMVIGCAATFVLCRDLYRRNFPNPHEKILWAIVWAICWPSVFVYLYRHGFRPR